MLRLRQSLLEKGKGTGIQSWVCHNYRQINNSKAGRGHLTVGLRGVRASGGGGGGKRLGLALIRKKNTKLHISHMVAVYNYAFCASEP